MLFLVFLSFFELEGREPCGPHINSLNSFKESPLHQLKISLIAILTNMNLMARENSKPATADPNGKWHL